MRLYALSQLVFLSLMWGPAFLWMKLAVREVPPLTVVAIRVSLAAALLYLILKLQRRPLPKFGRIWLHFTVMGLTANATPFFLLTWGQQYVDSALAAILVGTMPIFTMLLAHLTIADDRLSPGKILGVMLGFGGLVALFLPALSDGVNASLWGLGAAVGAALSYSVSFVYARKYMRGLPPLVGPAAQLITATVCLFPLALLLEQPYTVPLPSWPVIGSLLLLGGWSTCLAFVVYYRAMERISPSVLSLVTYLNAAVAVILGVLVLDEQLRWNAYLGFLLILSGATIVNGLVNVDGLRLRRLARRAPAES